MGWFTKAIALVLALVASAAFAQTQPATTQPAHHKAAVVVLEGQIDDYTRDTLFKRFADARASGADTVILSIDTYGGLVTAGLDISSFIKQQKDLHTIAFVHNKAISAGAMIAMACDEIVMEPVAKLGDCAPIMIREDGSLEGMPDTERAKMESPILADFRDSAQRNGYDPLVAESMVNVTRVVHYIVSPDGEKKFVNQADYDKLIAEGWTPVPGVRDPLDDDKSLLTVHTDEAAKIGLCKAIEATPESLASSRGYDLIATFAPSPGDKIVELLNSTIARGLLIALFIIAVKIAFSAPGHGLAEAVALITLGLVIGVPLLTGYAQWWEIVIIFLGLALLAFEIFVFPGHFVSGALGALMVIGGLVMTFVPKEPGGIPGFLPSLNGTYVAFERGLIVVVSGLLCSLVLWIWLSRYLPKIPYFQKLVLTTTVGSTHQGPIVETGIWPSVGASGRAITDLRPGGKAAFLDPALGDERVTQVVSDSGFVIAGSPLIVREVAGNRVVVRTV
jgi:membrane-bound serine protease (ClpP class)